MIIHDLQERVQTIRRQSRELRETNDCAVRAVAMATGFPYATVHAVMASRKIPAQLRERRRMRDVARDLRSRRSSLSAEALRFRPHLESMLWIWQVRTGMIILVLGSFHLILIGIDVLTPLFGERAGIEAASTLARVSSGLWIVYGVLLVCVEFHASVGLYRLACLLYTSPSPRDVEESRMPSSA